MTASIVRYKHYLLVVGALCLTNYVLLPLSEWQTTQQQRLILLATKQSKTDNLLANDSLLPDLIAQSQKHFEQLRPWLYSASSETDFKLEVQQKIEQVLLTAGCNIQRFGFKETVNVSEYFSRKTVELLYKGAPLCHIQSMRLLESMQPLIKINSYSISNRAFKFTTKDNVNATLNLSLWHLKDGK